MSNNTYPIDKPVSVNKKSLHIRKRWAAYLKEVMKLPPGVSVGALAKELIGAETREEIERMPSPAIYLQDASPRPRVRQWLKGLGTVRAASAFATGEALRRLGVPRTSGVVALFAAGYFPEVVELLFRMSQEHGGELPALAYYVSLEYWLHCWILNEFFSTKDEPYDYDLDDEHVRDARILVEAAIEGSAAFVSDVWATCGGGRNCAWWVKKAIAAGAFESDLDVRGSFDMAWSGMRDWARQLFVQCGGKRGESPYIQHFRISDFVPDLKPLRLLSERKG